MKKLTSLALCLIVVLGLGSIAHAEESQTKLVYWHHDASDSIVKAMEKLIADFETQNPDIDVDFLALPADSFYQKYQIAIATNTAPDVFGMRAAELSAVVAMDALLPLDEHLAQWSEYGDMNEAAMTAIRALAPDGQVYLLPGYTNVNVNWYNTALLEEKGMAIPSTIDEFLADCAQAADAENGKYFYTFRGGKSAWSNVLPFVMSYAGLDSIFDADGNCRLNTPAAVEGLAKYIEIYKNGWCSRDGINNSYKEMVLEFGSGTAMMMSHNSSSLPEHMKNLGEGNFMLDVASFAGQDGMRCVSMLEPLGASVSAGTKHVEEAVRLVEFLGSAQAMSYYCELVGKVPVNEGIYTHEWFTQSPYMMRVQDILSDASIAWFLLPQYLPEWYDISLEIDANVQAMCLGEANPADVLANWAQRLTVCQKAYLSA